MKPSKHPPNQRQLRVGEEIRHALSDIFMRGETGDPYLGSVSITVSEVRISPDLKNATAYVMPLGGTNRDVLIDALMKVAPYLRTLVSKKVLLRHAPRIGFRIDNSFDEASRIEELLRRPEVARDLGDDK